MERLDRETADRSHQDVEETRDTDERPLRFAGSVGGAEVEVRGEKSVKVITDEGAGGVLILTRGAEIRGRAPSKTPAKKD